MTHNTIQLILAIIIFAVACLPIIRTAIRHNTTDGLTFKMQLVEMLAAGFMFIVLLIGGQILIYLILNAP